MITEDQFSADENHKGKNKRHLSFALQGEMEKVKIKKSNTLFHKARKDRYGSPIKKGGKHRICFKDKIKGEKHRLCEIVNIPLALNSSLQDDSEVEGVEVEKPEANVTDPPKKVDKKPDEKEEKKIVNSKLAFKKSLSSKGGKEDENCSCACFIF